MLCTPAALQGFDDVLFARTDAPIEQLRQLNCIAFPRHDDRIQFSQRSCSDFIRERSERATSSIRKQDAPPCESRSQRAVLGLQVFDLRAGLSLEPTGHARN